MSIELGSSPCTITSASATEIVCTLDVATPMSAGNHAPQIRIASGFVAVDSGVSDLIGDVCQVS